MARLELRAITPSRAKLLDRQKLRQELIAEGIDDAKRQALNMAQATVRTWNHKPSFGSRFVAGADFIAVEVFPTGAHAKIWIYVSVGTRAHIITPKKARVLRFRQRYRAKTRPRVLGSRAGGSSGAFISARRVRHPGTQARQFTQEIGKRLRPRFRRRIESVLRRHARRARRA